MPIQRVLNEGSLEYHGCTAPSGIYPAETETSHS